MAIKKFSKEVKSKLNYYVYMLIDPRNGQTFYVGKGKGNRVFAHVNDALADYEGESYIEKDDDDTTNKIQQIKDIRRAGLEVMHIIVKHNMDEDTAFAVEAALIDTLPGLANEVKGHHSNDFGIANAEQLQKRYSLKEYKEPDFDYMMIKITNGILEDRGNNEYEACRSAWKYRKSKLEKYKYVLCVLHGVVINVFEPEYWQNDSRAISGRYEFVGREAPKEIKDKFVGYRIPARFTKKGLASPVLFSDGVK